MTVQNEQKSQTARPSEQQGPTLQRSSSETGISPRGRSSVLGFGFSPHEFFRSTPFSLIRKMAEEMDRVIQEFGLEHEGVSRAGGWAPAIEVTEHDGDYSVRAELPGLSPDDVKVEVANDALVIQGERKFEHQEKEGGVQRTERQYGLFYRRVPLPEGADIDHANAKFQNGMLEVTVPVPQQKEQRRSIPIQGETRAQTDPQKRAA